MARRDDSAYVDFVNAASRSLRRTAYLVCGDWGLAEDLVQDALLKLYVAWPRVASVEGAHGYARRTVVNVAIDAGRKSSKFGHTSAEIPELPDDRDAVGAFDTRTVVMAGLRELPPKARACVVLRYFDDLSVQETAQILGISVGTVKSQTSRGLELLRSTLERGGVTLEPVGDGR
ncbi:SigE family RNA polymerase sigma factor [Kribbella deserti]|uniref:SigE family RNA polymerase sigma factor n=1 Tax=Kribbella deserti TaxID=1926257 RepID=A0ABV6QT50_9ACTN